MTPNRLTLPALFESAVLPVQRFLRLEAAGGALLLVAAVAALVWANLHPQGYEHTFSYPLTFGAGGAVATFTLRDAINDGMMAIFFFVVGMEIKRELVVGELNTPAKASLPVIAALGGMLVPAAIFLAFTRGGPGAAGWGVSMATDIAFCVGILTMLKSRVPKSLIVFVTALAIFDDIGGILVIAFCYGDAPNLAYLGGAALLSLVLIAMGRAYVTNGLAYAVVGVCLWYAIHHGGVHATIAGVVLGLSIPARQRVPPRDVLEALSGHVSALLRGAPDDDLDHAQVTSIKEDLEDLGTPVQRYIHALHPLVTFVVMPLFALANSGVSVRGLGPESFTSPVALGIAAGLAVGKPLGIFGFTALAVRMGLAPMPQGSNRVQLLGVSVIAGIGFTVALFIAALAFDREPALLDQAKLGIIVASCIAGGSWISVPLVGSGKAPQSIVIGTEPASPGAVKAAERTRALCHMSLGYPSISWYPTICMHGAVRFFFALLAGLALLTAVGYFAWMRTTRGWFERDLALRANLAVVSARGSLTRNWASDTRRLAETLADISRDERIMGAAACTPLGELVAHSPGYPTEVSGSGILERMRREVGTEARSWSVPIDLPLGRVQLSVVSLDGADGLLGAVLLLHDLSFLDRREATMRNFLLAGFFVLSLGASIVTFVAARFARRSWIVDLRRALTGEPNEEFKPLVRDVRSLVERLAREREAPGGRWSPERLRATLTQYLENERVVLLANREPYIHHRTESGIRILHPASGLVTALEPVMRSCSGVWVAHGSGSADRETVDADDHVRVPPGEHSYSLRRVWLTEAEENGYYYGFSNEGLWPLCHVADARPVFRDEDWKNYVRVNRKFADAVCEEVSSDDPIVLVQDYHFALAPKMIRERIPKATIITFWHIPWPSAERFGICPWHDELLSGLLGSSILGFHTQQHCNNLIDSVDAFMESRIDREQNAVVQSARRTLVRPYPISIEWPVRWLEGVPSVEECRRAVRRELGLAENALVGVGVDRLDYTKGIEERLAAVNELLERHPEFRGKFTFVQIAAPSRTKIARYQDLNDRVDALAREVNDKWAKGEYRPIVLLREHHEPPSVFRLYRAAELCYVSSLHDGMNLVAKEFVAARDDEQGVLVLSEFTGAARDLTEALIVNPYDLRQASDALAAALRMSSVEQHERMQSMRRLVSEFNVYRWAGRMLVDAAELRRRERMSGRFLPIHSIARLYRA